MDPWCTRLAVDVSPLCVRLLIHSKSYTTSVLCDGSVYGPIVEGTGSEGYTGSVYGPIVHGIGSEGYTTLCALIQCTYFVCLPGAVVFRLEHLFCKVFGCRKYAF